MEAQRSSELATAEVVEQVYKLALEGDPQANSLPTNAPPILDSPPNMPSTPPPPPLPTIHTPTRRRPRITRTATIHPLQLHIRHQQLPLRTLLQNRHLLRPVAGAPHNRQRPRRARGRRAEMVRKRRPAFRPTREREVEIVVELLGLAARPRHLRTRVVRG